MLSQNHFFLTQTYAHKLDCLHPIFPILLAQDHIPSEHCWRCSKEQLLPMLHVRPSKSVFSHPRFLLVYQFTAQLMNMRCLRYSIRLELINNKPLGPINTSDRSQPQHIEQRFWVGTSLLLIFEDKFLIIFIQNKYGGDAQSYYYFLGIFHSLRKIWGNFNKTSNQNKEPQIKWPLLSLFPLTTSFPNKSGINS